MSFLETIDDSYVRMCHLATTAPRKARTYTTKDGQVIKIKAKPAKRGLLPLGESTIWEKVKRGKFPAPIKLSERVTVWRLSDVQAWIESRAST